MPDCGLGNTGADGAPRTEPDLDPDAPREKLWRVEWELVNKENLAGGWLNLSGGDGHIKRPSFSHSRKLLKQII